MYYKIEPAKRQAAQCAPCRREGGKAAVISLPGVIDMHVHTNPDLRARRYDDFDLCDAAVRTGARAIVLKSHLGSTAERAALCRRYIQRVAPTSGFTMLGSITLNRCVGGINPTAVENALKLGARIVYLPTQSARNHLRKMGSPADGAVDVTHGHALLPAVRDVLRLIREHGAAIATAHIAPWEAELVAHTAHAMGIRRILITHPEWWLVDMDEATQLRLMRESGAVIERCYAQNMGAGQYRSNLPQTLDFIRRNGYQNIVLSTDGGQLENPPWEEAMAQTIRYMTDHGVPAAHVQQMTGGLPARLLGLGDG